MTISIRVEKSLVKCNIDSWVKKKKNTQLPLQDKKVFLRSQQLTPYSRVKQENGDPQTGIKGGDVHRYVYKKSLLQNK